MEKKIQNRLKRVEGQVRGVGSMVDRGEYYTNIITQISAIKSALVSVENILIENHLESQTNKTLDEKTKLEIMKIFNKRK
ncbi:MAG: metal-sensitive transcriptional regulator [Candidatus Pacebacteria bacterium]|nr:metal-sensitive transcriptional regulator [Candidatus Paceibacterota bacterium]